MTEDNTDKDSPVKYFILPWAFSRKFWEAVATGMAGPAVLLILSKFSNSTFGYAFSVIASIYMATFGMIRCRIRNSIRTGIIASIVGSAGWSWLIAYIPRYFQLVSSHTSLVMYVLLFPALGSAAVWMLIRYTTKETKKMATLTWINIQNGAYTIEPASCGNGTDIAVQSTDLPLKDLNYIAEYWETHQREILTTLKKSYGIVPTTVSAPYGGIPDIIDTGVAGMIVTPTPLQWFPLHTDPRAS